MMDSTTSDGKPKINLKKISKAISLICGEGVTEVRALEATAKGDRWSATYFGYFDDSEKLAKTVGDITKAKGIYFVPNAVNPALLSRAANRLVKAGKGATTQDTDIVRRQWLLIDVDAQRPSGISSTDVEHGLAINKCREIYQHLKRQDWSDPIAADSGNGGHLLYRIDLPADDDGIVERCLKALAARFDDNVVHIDTTVHNAARIWKLYGTVACKGDSTSDRPHRMSKILSIPEKNKVIPVELLESLSTESPKPEPRSSVAPTNGQAFDIEGFILRHGLDVTNPHQSGDKTVWEFRTSPMCDHNDDGPHLIRFTNGALHAGCHHNSCSWTWQDLRAKFELDMGRPQKPADSVKVLPKAANHPREESERPEVLLPGGSVEITICAEQLGDFLAKRRTHYVRGDAIVKIDSDNDTGDPVLLLVKPSRLASDFERVAELKKIKTDKKGAVCHIPTICSEANARLIGNSQAFHDALPIIRVLSRCPVLVEQDGKLVEINGYHEGSGVLASGQAAVEVSLEKAKELLYGAIADFRFATESDQSRAMAALITPALVIGGLIKGRAPVDLGEADKSQTGKGYRNKITGAIYRHMPQVVSQRRGIGSIEEAFDKALISGASFISIDNIRGKVDSPSIESFLTENTYSARTPYSPVVLIDPRRVVVMFTSNKADITRDLANRCSCVRILKQEAGYQYTSYPEGDILAHIENNQSLYLGAVFAVVRAWHAAGKTRTNETRHDFRAWAQTLDWIVQNLLGAAPLMDGHQETQERMTNPAMNWLRDVAQVVVRASKGNEWLKTHQILDLIDDAGDVEIPGLADGGNIEDGNARGPVLTAMGWRFKKCFGDRDSVQIDQVQIERSESTDDNYRRRYDYRFLALVDPRNCDQDPSDRELENVETHPTGGNEHGHQDDFQTKPPQVGPKPPQFPRNSPAIISRDPRNPRGTPELVVCNSESDLIHGPLCNIAGVTGVGGVEELEQPESKPKLHPPDDPEMEVFTI
jgi:hypothetical protein